MEMSNQSNGHGFGPRRASRGMNFDNIQQYDSYPRVNSSNNRGRASNYRLNHGPRRDFRPQSSYSPRSYLNCTPSPRSFDDLANERGYLLNSLQREDHRATDLLKTLASYQATLDSGFDTANGKRVRKHMSWVRHQLDETTRQEKSILARLGQITYEIQFKERWSRVEWEMGHVGRDPEMEMGGGYGLGILDATTPEFTPMGIWVAQATLDANTNANSTQESNTNMCAYTQPQAAGEETNLSGDSAFSEQLDNVKAATTHVRSASMTTLEDEQHSSPTSAEKERRLSMPDVRATWDDGYETQYVGYYISGQ